MPSALASAVIPPTYLWVPPYHHTYGPEVADLNESIGFAPDPEQRLILDGVFAVDARGKSAARDVSIEAPRQNIKTGVLKQCAIGWLFLLELRVVTWTAQEFSTSQEAFRDMCQLIESAPDLDAEVKQIHRGNGDEAIELKGDRRLKFRARTRSGGRGWTGDRVVLDEAMYVTKSQLASLSPTTRAVWDPQLVFAGSGGLIESEEWRRLRDRVKSGKDPSIAGFLWSDPRAWTGCMDPDCTHIYGRVDGCALDDEDRYWALNTALTRGRIDIESLRADRRLLDPLKFATETLGWWEDPPDGDEADDIMAGWPDAKTDRAPSGPLRLGVGVSHDSRSGALVILGGGVFEVVDYRKGKGTDWIPARVAEVRQRQAIASVGLLGNTQAEALAEHIPDAVVVSQVQQRVASLALVQGVPGRFAHRDQPPLNLAVSGAVRQISGDGWRWSSRLSAMKGTDISPLHAAVAAVHLAGSSPPDYNIEDSAW